MANILRQSLIDVAKALVLVFVIAPLIVAVGIALLFAGAYAGYLVTGGGVVGTLIGAAVMWLALLCSIVVWLEWTLAD